MPNKNIVFVFADQWRAQSVGYRNPEVKTPHIDALERESINFTNAISGCPICTPYRASLLTGQHPLTHGLFMNDLALDPDIPAMGDIFKSAGYDTAWIGKWHADGHGRSTYIPPERRAGFDYWKTLECTHYYDHSLYYEGNDPTPREWEGYDALAQTKDAVGYIENRTGDKPFLLVLSYGTPHDPYDMVPDKYKAMYDPAALTIPPNVPPECEAQARRDLRDYYAHISALDDCVGELRAALDRMSLTGDTIFVLTSDHGDSLWSQCTLETGNINKQRPYEESINVPFLLYQQGKRPFMTDILLAAQDILPTLCGLCEVDCPDTVEGVDLTKTLSGEESEPHEGVLIASYVPFANYAPCVGGHAYRSVRTRWFMYAETHEGPWLFYNLIEDPQQLNNLLPELIDFPVRKELRRLMYKLMAEQGDTFETHEELSARYGFHSLTPYNEIPYEKGDEWYARQKELL